MKNNILILVLYLAIINADYFVVSKLFSTGKYNYVSSLIINTIVFLSVFIIGRL